MATEGYGHCLRCYCFRTLPYRRFAPLPLKGAHRRFAPLPLKGEAFLHYLDTGIVGCLVVPDEFNVGYQSLKEAAESLTHYLHKMQDRTVSYNVIRRDNLFSRENQEIIFTMSQ